MTRRTLDQQLWRRAAYDPQITATWLKTEEYVKQAELWRLRRAARTQ